MRLTTPIRSWTLATLCLGILALPGAAQQLIVDRGTFLLSREGRAVGTEEFIIRRTGTGSDARIIATADIHVQPDSHTRSVTSAMELSSGGLDVRAYQVKVSGDAATELYMTLADGRYQAKVVTERGEQLREFRARRGSVLLDEEIVHHYHFLAARALDGSSAVPALVPRAGRQTRADVVDEGTERIRIAGRAVEARQLQVHLDASTRRLWVDAEGRVLRLVDLETGFRAERKDLPD